MGLFGKVKNNWHKAQAAAIVQGMFEHHQQNGVFDLNPATTANVLVENLWSGAPNTFDGRHGYRPHKITAAAAAMMAVVYNAAKNGKLETNVLAMSMCVFQILKEIDEHPTRYPLNQLDEGVLTEVHRQFDEVQDDLTDAAALR